MPQPPYQNYDGVRPSFMVFYDTWGVPLLTLRSGEGLVKMGPVCFAPGQFPRIQMINHWNQGQHMYATFSGSYR